MLDIILYKLYQYEYIILGDLLILNPIDIESN